MDQRESAGGPRDEAAHHVDAADRVCAVEQAHAHRRLPAAHGDDRQRRALDADESRSHRALRRAARSVDAGGFAPPGGAIESISPSTVSNGTIWVGTGNGLVKLTRNSGKTWEDVTIAGLPNPSRAEVNIEASHIDAASAYASVDLHRIGDYKPYFFRTHDFGKTWTKITADLPTESAEWQLLARDPE